MKIFIHGHDQYLATQERDCEMDVPQPSIVVQVNQDKSPDGTPLLNATGASPKRYLLLEYTLIECKEHEGMPCYQFNKVLEER